MARINFQSLLIQIGRFVKLLRLQGQVGRSGHLSSGLIFRAGRIRTALIENRPLNRRRRQRTGPILGGELIRLLRRLTEGWIAGLSWRVSGRQRIRSGRRLIQPCRRRPPLISLGCNWRWLGRG